MTGLLEGCSACADPRPSPVSRTQPQLAGRSADPEPSPASHIEPRIYYFMGLREETPHSDTTNTVEFTIHLGMAF